MRVLLVEDEDLIAQALALALGDDGFNVTTTGLGEEAIELARYGAYDAVLLNIGLPDIGGIDVLRTLRLAKVVTPVIMLSGASLLEAKLKAFSSGADDYVTKPCEAKEVAARLRAVVCRARGHAEPAIRVGELVVKLDARVAEAKGRRLPLSPKEFQVLELLALRKGATITKDMFLNHLYGGMDEPERTIIDVFISKLRRKLEAALGDDCIETVWGHGYALREPPEALVARAA